MDNPNGRNYMRIRYPLIIALLFTFTWGYAADHEVGVTGPITAGSKGGPFAAPTIDVAARGYEWKNIFLRGSRAPIEP